MTPADFLAKAEQAATEGGHIFPQYAACEAALESAWGESKLCKLANNLFGQKHGKEQYPTVNIPTHEVIAGKDAIVQAEWPVFPDWATSFSERMALLHRVAAYGPALAATGGEAFVLAVSKVWSTDPARGMKVLAIYRTHYGH